MVSPSLDLGKGRTRELIDELRTLWRKHANEGADEICAVVDLLADVEQLPYLFKPIAGSPQLRFLEAFSKYLTAGSWRDNQELQRILAQRGEQSISWGSAGVATATGGLHAALQALGVCGGEVITSSLNYVGVINAIVLAGAVPRFVDIDPATWCLDPEAVRTAITADTRAILLTHLNHFVELEPFVEICEAGDRMIPLVQDASLAIGSSREGLRPGFVNIGQPGVTVASLTISKILSGLGGAIVTSDSQHLINQIQTIASQGVNFFNEAQLEDVGANYKFSALHATIAKSMLSRMDAIVTRRRELRAGFEQGLAALKGEGLIEFQQLSSDDVVTHFGILLPCGADWKTLAQNLFERHQISTGRWHCMHRELIYQSYARCAPEGLPVTDAIGPRHVFLPFHTALTDNDVRTICTKVQEEIRRL